MAPPGGAGTIILMGLLGYTCERHKFGNIETVRVVAQAIKIFLSSIFYPIFFNLQLASSNEWHIACHDGHIQNVGF
jgi:hypothetical protein